MKLNDLRQASPVQFHKSNPGHPTSWYVLNRELAHGPFTYLNPALLQPKPITLKKGDTLTQRHRIVVHDGSLKPDRLHSLWKAFSQAATP